mmetsp:Transcript_10904/g.20854  ORF Transcript_10904/g.20854 Transcript_10904/m.20854 type:complete len:91 (+) Transcript_10904:3-275(+)
MCKHILYFCRRSFKFENAPGQFSVLHMHLASAGVAVHLRVEQMRAYGLLATQESYNPHVPPVPNDAADIIKDLHQAKLIFHQDRRTCVCV